MDFFLSLSLPLWHPERGGSGSALWLMVWQCEARQVCLITGKLGEIKEELICLPSPDLSGSLAPASFSLLKRYGGKIWWLWGPSFPAGWCHAVFSLFACQGAARSHECFVFALTPDCYTPLLYCAMHAVNLFGRQVLIRCTTDHTAQQLFTHCSACTHSQRAQIQTCCNLW